MIIEKWKPSLRALCAFSVLSVTSFITPAHSATYPQWWIDQGVITDGQQPPAAPGETGHDPAVWDAWVAGNFAPANAGQAKNLAEKAMLEMEAKQVSSAGTTITSLVNGFSTTPETNYVPINAGQVKALAKTFYDHFHDLDFTVTLSDGTIIADNTYPWDPATPVEQNYAPVNVGQLKYVFSFSLEDWPPPSAIIDSDNDGLADSIEIVIGSDLNNPDTDGNGLLDGEEYYAGLDPVNDVDLNDNYLPDDWEAFYANEVSVFPHKLVLKLDWGGQESRSLYFNNDTTAAVDYTVSLTGDLVSGYSWEDSLTGSAVYAWNDISAIPNTELTSLTNTSNDSTLVNFASFSFPLYGRQYSEIWVSTNGYLNFVAEKNSVNNTTLPKDNTPKGLIAAFWDYLDLSEGGKVHVYEEADKFTVQYEQAIRNSGTGTMTFQIVLHSDGTIDFFYKQMNGTVNLCTIGIQNTTLQQGLEIVHDTAYIQDNLAVRIEPIKQLFDILPLSDTIAASSIDVLDVDFDKDNVFPGTYTGSLSFAHTGNGTTPWSVPVEIEIPYVNMTQPVAGYTIWEGENLNQTSTRLGTRFTDTPADITQVEFHNQSGLIGIGTGPIWNNFYYFNWNNVPAGNHEVYAHLVMDDGTTSDSNPVSVIAIADEDSDRMPDEWENDPLLFGGLSQEASADFDNDGFPNIFEYHHGTNPNDATSFPLFDPDPLQETESPSHDIGLVHYYRVDKSLAMDTDYEKSTISAALAAARDFDIIEVLPSSESYDESISIFYRVYLFSSNGAEETIVDNTGSAGRAVSINAEAVVQGFTFKNGGTTDNTSIRFGSSLYFSVSSTWDKPRIIGCVIAENKTYASGSIIYISSGNPYFVSCTIANNTSGDGTPIRIVSSHSVDRIATFINSILWNPGAGIEEAGYDSENYVYINSIIRENDAGHILLNGTSVGDTQFGLSAYYGIHHNSIAKDAGTNQAFSLHDMHNEERVDGLVDIGADEVVDADSNGLADAWEVYFDITDPSGNADTDSLTNLEEYLNAANPLLEDTDGDTLPDDWEVAHQENPSISYISQDRDYDGFDTLQEYTYGTNPDLFDSNGDSLSDSFAVILGLDPASGDTDGDGLTNAQEWLAGTDLLVADTDGDGVNDGLDIAPLDPTLSTLPASDPNDTTAPVITLHSPVGAVLL
ncbi:hypothetical protein [Rubellicoccus peritrichatus]|uniref:Pectate lyase C n=1 Tax=Rubellicoccus peritrichatus TaxID=3080537 RepID=A0AAQ3QW25_9BACT|nr:hypothetical protein [Puniceicoccus sp. CR14]WOO42198.1 hypothetical protein RZN69_03790 [Puniceicoccus sp. CR14]